MARTSGPLGSVDASGTIGDVLTFSKWKGRNYVRTVPGRAALPTNTQISSRAMMGYLAARWKADIDPTDQATWNALAESLELPAYNAFLRVNLERWIQQLAPTMVNPADAGGAAPIIVPLPTATGQVGQALINWGVLNQREGWTFMIHRATTTGFTPTHDNLVGATPLGPFGSHQFLDRPIAPGTYFWNIVRSLNHGRTIGSLPETSATVT